MNFNIIVPMAGAGSRFTQAGYKKPKPFIDVLGKPMILHVLENLNIKNARYILICREEHLLSEPDTVKELENNYNIEFIPINYLTEGAACTVLHAHKFINNDEPLLIANSDQIVDMNISDYIQDNFERNLDGSILTFEDNHPKWSFAKIDANGIVTEVKEKEPISNYATVGIYLFTKGRTFVESAIDMIVRNDRVNNEFYVCPVYNYSIKEGSKIGIYNIDKDQMHGTGTPEDLNLYIDFKKGLASV
ncbi:MAG: lipopolysaccharide biosynthesis protein [Candidatus Melainabacteria bacterium RIFOXYA12_FULL_32_12]|nr:MAG: lipopolysaccharide biosynthesis protein [Candidatus Melainabacteria bacterium RIFOXYA2_FULL_32_9]OGI29260.1 MAG: lipopolysaccharide biosynthesis protein [Candidatus Melainabacteria bacterium RIFOXYA12_FULL_32_12]